MYLQFPFYGPGCGGVEKCNVGGHRHLGLKSLSDDTALRLLVMTEAPDYVCLEKNDSLKVKPLKGGRGD